VVPGDDPQQIYVKRVDVEILWAQLDPPPVVELLTDLTTALAASPDVRISPYAMLGEVRRALERYAERCQAEGAA
jgi:hypothetical protein